MKHSNLQKALVALAGVISIGAVQAQSGIPGAGTQAAAPILTVSDWSSRAVIHRQPLAPDEFEAQGRDAELQQRYRDPRYVASVLRRFEAEQRRPSLGQQAKSGETASRGRDRHRDPRKPPSSAGDGSLVRDWSNVLGGGVNGLGGRGVPGVFPAKYNFDITAAPSCANDFAVYPTNAAGNTSSGAEETYISSFTGDPGQGANRTVTVGATAPRRVVLTSHATDNTGLNFRTAGVDNNSRATNLGEAINRWSHQTGLRAEVVGAQVTVYSNTVGNVPDNAMSEALDNFDGNSSWPGSNGSGTPGQPTIIAFNQLYQGAGACNGSWNRSGTTKAPNTMWAYNTGTGYVVETSPVLSYYDDGKQVAFIQRSGNTLQLVLLKWAAGQGVAGAPATPAIIAANGAGYAAQRGSAGSVMYVMTLDGTSNVGSTPTYSSPFVDYVNDVLWVGDGNGRLHKFTGVFQGTPAEVVVNFPRTLEAGLKMSSPVANNGQVYIGSSAGTGTVGGKLYRVRASDGVVLATSAKLTRDDTPGVRESPIIDGATGRIYTFVYNDNTSVYTDAGRCDAFAGETDGCRAVIQFTEFFANGTIGSRQFIGRGNGVSRVLYAGAFDDAFYNSNNGTGAMYIVGGRPDNTFYATMWKIPIISGVMQTPVQGHTFGDRDRYVEDDDANSGTDNLQQIAPATVIKNGSNEYVFVSTASYADANVDGCGPNTGSGTINDACVYMYNLADLNGAGAGTGATWATTNVPSAGLAAPGGTGGIVVDNTSASTGASQVYFSQLQAGGNAIQASQATLD